MEQGFDKFLMFRNRLQKVFRHLSKQALKQNITCYRIYNHDLPEFPFIIEFYEGKLYVAEYKRQHNMGEEEYFLWMEKSKEVMCQELAVNGDNVFLKLRQRKEGRQGQYQKFDQRKNEFEVKENGLSFIVNLTDYLDTGLFLDHRTTRKMVQEISRDKKVLNLFSYTGSFSVYAAAGGASSVTSVDLSKTYLDWAQRNMELNFPEGIMHKIVQGDVIDELRRISARSFDIIVMDPPTFSNSKRMDDFLDIQRDHVMLINNCMRILKENGVLIFSTNFSKFKIDAEKINAAEIKDITKTTTPFDFAGKLQRQCFKISR